jgi:hypothetical protein
MGARKEGQFLIDRSFKKTRCLNRNVSPCPFESCRQADVSEFECTLHNKQLLPNVVNSDNCMSGNSNIRTKEITLRHSTNNTLPKRNVKIFTKGHSMFKQTVRRNVVFLFLVFLLFQLSFVSCQVFEPDVDDSFDDFDKSTTTSRDNAGGHSFSSSPYPHQVILIVFKKIKTWEHLGFQKKEVISRTSV